MFSELFMPGSDLRPARPELREAADRFGVLP
jgi:hypothetical protein